MFAVNYQTQNTECNSIAMSNSLPWSLCIFYMMQPLDLSFIRGGYNLFLFIIIMSEISNSVKSSLFPELNTYTVLAT